MPDGSDAEYLAYVHGRTQALRRVAYLLCGDTHQADDLVQETITKLYARWPRLTKVENLDAYVHTMLVRTFLDERRRGWWKVGLFGAAPERPAPAGVPAEDRSVLRAALSRVPARQQAVAGGGRDGRPGAAPPAGGRHVRAAAGRGGAVAGAPETGTVHGHPAADGRRGQGGRDGR